MKNYTPDLKLIIGHTYVRVYEEYDFKYEETPASIDETISRLRMGSAYSCKQTLTVENQNSKTVYNVTERLPNACLPLNQGFSIMRGHEEEYVDVFLPYEQFILLEEVPNTDFLQNITNFKALQAFHVSETNIYYSETF